jgi:hypothetical protein
MLLLLAVVEEQLTMVEAVAPVVIVQEQLQ